MARTFCHAIDVINDWVGRLTSALFIPLTFIVFLEVTLRYFFNRPTIWAWDVIIQLAAVIAVLAAGYNLARREHVMIDIVVGRFPPRTRAIIDLVSGLVFFMAIGVVAWYAVKISVWSVRIQEGFTGVWEPPFYQVRVLIAIGVILLLLQGIVKFIRDLNIVIRRSEGDTQ